VPTDEQPATKKDLADLRDGLRGEMRAMEQRLRADLRQAWREDMGVEIAHALAVSREEFQSWARTFDDKYKDLPGRVTRLERDVEELKRPAPTPPPRRKKSAR
jgi:hypothetical protein